MAGIWNSLLAGSRGGVLIMTAGSTEHTPPPWVVSRIDKTLIGGRRGFSYSNIAKTIVIPAHGPEKYAIAEANARLIAAAPERAEIADEMLVALKTIMAEAIACQNETLISDAAGYLEAIERLAETAIARAKEYAT